MNDSSIQSMFCVLSVSRECPGGNSPNDSNDTTRRYHTNTNYSIRSTAMTQQEPCPEDMLCSLFSFCFSSLWLVQSSWAATWVKLGAYNMFCDRKHHVANPTACPASNAWQTWCRAAPYGRLYSNMTTSTLVQHDNQYISTTRQPVH